MSFSRRHAYLEARYLLTSRAGKLKAKSAEASAQLAITYIPRSVLWVLSFSHPINEGLRIPPRLPTELIKAIATGALGSPTNAVAKLHCIGRALINPAAARDKAATARIRWWLNTTLRAKPNAP